MKEPLVVITNNGTDFIKRQSITFANSYCNILYNIKVTILLQVIINLFQRLVQIKEAIMYSLN